jgi:Cdc6-like AAA superfamily ATPase
MKLAERLELKAKAERLFSPRTPISKSDLFSGRQSQITRILLAVKQEGAHTIVYGERGVGKTSFANCIRDFIAPLLPPTMPIVSPVVNCDSQDDYKSIWRKVFREIVLDHHTESIGLIPEQRIHSFSAADRLPVEFSPSDIKDLLNDIGQSVKLLVILDEFDRIASETVTRLIADTIKMLADHAVPATVVLVGVGDSVAQLVAGHESIGRRLIQVPMPRMSRGEIEDIVTERLPELGMQIDQEALDFIGTLSRGLPYYAHLLGLHASLVALDSDSTAVKGEHLSAAMRQAMDTSELSMKNAYHDATRSNRKDAIFAALLAACALVRCDEFGYFRASDLVDPMSRIRNRKYTPSMFDKQLKQFCTSRRGNILQRAGREFDWRYRFKDPLMESFVVLASLASGILKLKHLAEASRETKHH